MNQYEVAVCDEYCKFLYTFELRATSEEVERLAKDSIEYDENIQNITLLKRGAVPYDLSSGTSEC